ncbi:uncharacterized protein LOC117929758 [Vitis riparia]|uniref:uncharacterized protein LOC117929758 n=1 Tax=Vitis riparia TaxID=96939 RepID=UPI00155A118C|nr:uncharacterized protein LOC117929758 [Vitis riparia]
MKPFLVCFLLISVLLSPSCVSARELTQNEEMSSDKVGFIAGNLPDPPSTSKCNPGSRDCKECIKVHPAPEYIKAHTIHHPAPKYIKAHAFHLPAPKYIKAHTVHHPAPKYIKAHTIHHPAPKYIKVHTVHHTAPTTHQALETEKKLNKLDRHCI